MADGIGARENGPHEMLERMLPLLRDGDLSTLADLYAEDGVHELPFAPPGAPCRIEGRTKIREYFEILSGVPLDFQEFRLVAVYETDDPEVIVAEYDASGEVTTTGRTFTVRYLWVIGVSGGEISFWRDYWNPLEIMKLQGAETG